MNLEYRASQAWRKDLRDMADADEYEALRQEALRKIERAERALKNAPKMITLPLNDVKELLALAEKAIGKRPRRGV